MGRLLVGATLALLVATSQAGACDKAQMNASFRKFFTDKDSPYNLKFMAMTAESAKKYSSALDNLTDTFKEYFAKDEASLDAIKGCDKQTIIDAAIRGSKT